MEKIGEIIQRCQELNQENMKDLKPELKILNPNYENYDHLLIEKRSKHRFDEATKKSIDPLIWENIQEIFTQKDLGLYIYGKVGTGKTYLCYALSHEADKIFKNKQIKIISTPEIFTKIKATFNKDYEGESEETLIDELSGTEKKWNSPIDILFLDDIGIEKPTEWAQQTLHTIIDRRYLMCRKTIFTSNLSLDELSERIGDRIPSRIAEMCKIINLTGPDRRIKK